MEKSEIWGEITTHNVCLKGQIILLVSENFSDKDVDLSRKFGSKCLELSNSSRNGIKKSELNLNSVE